MIKIILICLVLITACGSSIAYGDYVDTTGWSRKQIESIKNHPKTPTVQGGKDKYQKNLTKIRTNLKQKILIT